MPRNTRTTHSHDGSPLIRCAICNNTARHGSVFCGRCEDINNTQSERDKRIERIRNNIEEIQDPVIKVALENVLELILDY